MIISVDSCLCPMRANSKCGAFHPLRMLPAEVLVVENTIAKWCPMKTDAVVLRLSAMNQEEVADAFAERMKARRQKHEEEGS